MLCANLFTLFLKDVKLPKYPPNFWAVGQIVMLLAGSHLALLLTGGPVEIAGLASGTTFVGTTGEGWKMTSEPLTRWQILSLKQTICAAYFIRIRCSLFPSVQGQHIWCLNLCRWAPLTQAESRSESETSNTCQMAEEIEMSFDCGFQLVQVCQNPSRITYFFWFFVQGCLYSFFLTDVKIREYMPRFLSVQTDCFVLTHIISVIEIAGLACGTTFVGTIEEGWEMTSDPLTKWHMLSLQSRQFVWRDKNDFSMSLISDPLCFEGSKVASHWINQGSMFDVWTSADDRFHHRQSSQVSLCLAWLAKWPRRLPCRLTVQDKSVRKSIFYWISLIKSFDVCAKLFVSSWKTWNSWNIRQIFERWGRLLCC